jgi:beta-lactamase regulating signal transducer with metallopeptidase domain
MMLEMLIALGWKSALIAALALIADRAMRGRPAAERVFVLRIAVAALLLLPLAMLLLPSLDLALLPALEAVTEVARTPGAVAVAPVLPGVTETRIDPAGLLYAAGAAAVLLHLAIGIAVLVHWTRRGVEASEPGWQVALARGATGLRRPVRLLVSNDVATPISWGIAPAWILIDPVTLARTGQADAVVAHEMAHIRRFDWPMLVAARVAVALLWFNPLVWLLNRTLAHRGETAADEAAVRGIERADYAQALLSFAAAPAARGVATGMALWPNALAERITHIAMHRPRRGSRLIPAAALGCMVIAAPLLAAARLVPAAPAGGALAARPTQPVVAPAGTDGVPSRTAPADGLVQTRAADIAASAAEPDHTIAAQASRPPADQPGSPVASAPSPVVQAASAPAPTPQPVRIVGQTGSSVVRTADGVTITAPPPLRLPVPPPGEDTPDWAEHAADQLTEGAAEIRGGAREVELTAELPGVSAGQRAEIAIRVREMRARADEFEARARALRARRG